MVVQTRLDRTTRPREALDDSRAGRDTAGENFIATI